MTSEDIFDNEEFKNDARILTPIEKTMKVEEDLRYLGQVPNFEGTSLESLRIESLRMKVATGDIPATIELAKRYKEGIGCVQDHLYAFNLTIEVLKKRDNADAFFLLAYYYENGIEGCHLVSTPFNGDTFIPIFEYDFNFMPSFKYDFNRKDYPKLKKLRKVDKGRANYARNLAFEMGYRYSVKDFDINFLV